VSALLTSTAIGLLAAWPASGLGWALGKAADAITDDPGPRAQAWALARALPVATLGLVTLASQLPASVAPPIVATMAGPETAATVAAIAQDLAVRGPALPHLPDLFETGAAALIATAAVGLVIASLRQVHGLRGLARIVADAQPAPAPMVQALKAAARRLGAPDAPVRISDAVDQPLLAGLERPVILLPAALTQSLDVERLTLICAHELAHLKRRDNWRLLVENLLGGLFWMVPPVAALRVRAAAVREELCDRLALQGAPAKVRRGYAESLIEVLRLRAAPSPYPAFTGKEGSPTAMRLKAIIAPRRSAGLARKAVIAAMGAATLVAAGACSYVAADHREAGHSITKTSIRSDDGGQRRVAIDISADSVQILGKDRSAYEGNVSLKGKLKSSGTVVLLDGRAPPADFDPTRLPAGAIKRVVVINNLDQEGGKVILDLTLAKQGAAATPEGLVNGVIDIAADSQEILPGGERRIFRGDVSMKGQLDLATYTLLVGDQPAPAGFDPGALPPGSIQSLEVTTAKAAGDGKMHLNFQMSDAYKAGLPS